MNLKIEQNGINYDIKVISYTKADRGDFFNPPQEAEVEYSVISITCDDENGFFIEDVVAGDIELHELVLEAYEQEQHDNECVIADMKRDALRDERL